MTWFCRVSRNSQNLHCPSWAHWPAVHPSHPSEKKICELHHRVLILSPYHPYPSPSEPAVFAIEMYFWRLSRARCDSSCFWSKSRPLNSKRTSLPQESQPIPQLMGWIRLKPTLFVEATDINGSEKMRNMRSGMEYVHLSSSQTFFAHNRDDCHSKKTSPMLHKVSSFTHFKLTLTLNIGPTLQ